MPQTVNNYIKDAIRTEKEEYSAEAGRLSCGSMPRILHGAMGICTEAGEILDAIKKHVYYGKPLDRVNLAEELGDVLWYIAILCDELGTDFPSIMKTNIAKLKTRFPEKFTQEKALERNLDAERNVLENGHS